MKLNHLLTATAALALMTAPAMAQDAAMTPGAKPAGATAAPTTPTTAPEAAPSAEPAATASASSATKVVASGDIIQTAQASGQFTTFLKAAEATNLTNLLKTQKNITVFAPTDAAFAALPAGELDKLMLPENKAELQKLLIYHVVNAPVKSADFKGSTRKAATVAGPSVDLNGGDTLMVNNANIVQADISASNGVIHVVDKVLMPTGALAATTGAATSASATAPATPEAPTSTPATTPSAKPQAPATQPSEAPKGE